MMKDDVNKFVWNELIVEDVAKAKKFYKELFDWDCKTVDVKEQNMKYYIFTHGDHDIAGLLKKPMEDTPICWFSYVTVKDLKKSLAKVKSIGGTIAVDIMSIGELGKLAVIVDTTGATLGLWQKGDKEI